MYKAIVRSHLDYCHVIYHLPPLLHQMYKAFVRSHLDYCHVIYHLPPLLYQAPLGVSLNSLMEKVERVQYQAALAITGAWNGSSRTKHYEELGWGIII